jgi:hypothetical protein
MVFEETTDCGIFRFRVALKNGMETVRGLRYKLRMMGIPIEGPAFAYGNNMSVIHNTQRPESILKKKSNSLCLLPLLQIVGCYGRMYDWACAYEIKPSRTVH